MKLSAYPTYKYSGIEWLGEIPEHWQLRSVRRITKTHKQGYYSQDDYIDEGVKLARITDIDDSGNISFLNMPYVQITENDEKAFKINHGDMFFARSGTIGRFGLAENPERSVFASYLIRFVFVVSNLHFLKYFLLSKYFKDSLISNLHGGANQNVHAENIKDQLICVPPDKEQATIVTFLDRETEQIDAVIAKKERQIELLQEKRAALISHVVTKGLDLNAKMKKSDVEWMGRIPSHWEVVPLRAVLVERGEYNIGPRTDNVLSVVKDVGVINYNERAASGNKKSDDIEQYKVIHKGDIVLNRMNVIIGSVGISNEYGAASIEYYVLHAKDDSSCTPYYGHIFCSRAFQINLGRLGSGILGHRLRIPFELMRMERLPKPPYSEQCKIADMLDHEKKRADDMIKKIYSSIEVLREYRLALISAAVTGKIDVRKEVA